jgi:hypothetical protein
MLVRVFVKTVFPVFVVGVVSTLLTNEAFAGGWFWGGGGWGGGGGGGPTGGGGAPGGGAGGGGSVPEIAAGTAATALSLIVGAGYLLKERFFENRSDETAS